MPIVRIVRDRADFIREITSHMERASFSAGAGTALATILEIFKDAEKNSKNIFHGIPPLEALDAHLLGIFLSIMKNYDDAALLLDAPEHIVN